MGARDTDAAASARRRPAPDRRPPINDAAPPRLDKGSVRSASGAIHCDTRSSSSRDAGCRKQAGTRNSAVEKARPHDPGNLLKTCGGDIVKPPLTPWNRCEPVDEHRRQLRGVSHHVEHTAGSAPDA